MLGVLKGVAFATGMRFLALAPLAVLAGCVGDPTALVIGTTTTTQDSGLLDALLPAFERAESLRARAVVGGTGEIIEKAKRGDVDVLLTHSPGRERSLLDAGIAATRRPVMFNRFAIVGETRDVAGVAGAGNASDAFARIHANRSTFVSRGDLSGTHDKELAIWKSATLDPTRFDHAWYKETGTGQGATLMVASELKAYLLVDEATLLRFHARGKAGNLGVLLVEDPVLRNQYAVTELEPARVPGPIQADAASRFATWITGPDGQAVIRSFEIGGRGVFVPNDDEPEA